MLTLAPLSEQVLWIRAFQPIFPRIVIKVKIAHEYLNYLSFYSTVLSIEQVLLIIIVRGRKVHGRE